MKDAIKKTAPLLLWLLLAVSGGCMDAYSYLFREQVFANAQTGNILLLGVNLSTGNFAVCFRYACPILAFVLGIMAAYLICRCAGKHVRAAKLLTVGGEILVLFAVAFMPQHLNVVANAMISLACGMQLECFSEFMGRRAATTMCIGNLRSMVHNSMDFAFGKDKEHLKNAAFFAISILFFALGAIIGNLFVKGFGAYAIWGSCLILLSCLGLICVRTA